MLHFASKLVTFRVNVTFCGVTGSLFHHVYVKRQTIICTTWQSFPFTCRVLFIISTHKLVVSDNFVIHKNRLSCFYLLIFCFKKLSTRIWCLPYTWSLKLSIPFFTRRHYRRLYPEHRFLSPILHPIQRLKQILSRYFAFSRIPFSKSIPVINVLPVPVTLGPSEETQNSSFNVEFWKL